MNWDTPRVDCEEILLTQNKKVFGIYFGNEIETYILYILELTLDIIKGDKG